MSDSSIAWQPSPEYLERSRLLRFMRRHGIGSYPELVRRSTDDLDWFWRATVEDLGLEWYRPFESVLDTSEGIPWTRWFSGGRFNYVHNAVDRPGRGPGAQETAIIWEGEDGAVRSVTGAELLAETNRLANALCSLGLGKGDRVGIFMPMTPETAAATLACSKIGAIYTPIFSGYGPEAIASRLNDCDARLLITADGFYRRGRVISMKATADTALERAPGVDNLLVLRRMGNDVAFRPPRDVWWHELVARQSALYETERTDPEDPFMIIYTSGTTGRPKGAVHVQAGFPLKGTQDMAHCFDVQAGDVFFWFTDLGWMMGPWAIAGALTLGATLVMYEGTPDYPAPDRVWDMVERHRINTLGISPTAVRALMAQDVDYVRRHDLSSLRVLGSTGEPWNPEPWRWYFEQVGGGRCPVINYTGGTEISGGILGCTTITPLKPCSFSGPIPGMAVDVVDEQGRSLRGEVGELVISKPWPGMTRGFWKDRERYLETYWSRIPGLWVHGDWAMADEDGFWFLLGRSDDTIKVASKRIGPAEIESAAVEHPAVMEAAAIGVPHELKGEVVVCFVVLGQGHEPSEGLRAEIRETIARLLGPTMRPEEVKFVRDLPKTRNAKIMRRVIKAKYLGKSDLGDLSGLENLAAVEDIARAR